MIPIIDIRDIWNPTRTNQSTKNRKEGKALEDTKSFQQNYFGTFSE